MGRTPCCDSDANVKKGPWTTEEDDKLREYIEENGASNWRNLPKLAGLNRCGKSCRLRWANYLRPDIKRGRFSDEEEQLIIHHHSVLGNKWSAIAARLPGRTDNEIKNYWNTHLRKKLLKMGIDPVTHRPRTDLNLFANIPNLIAAANLSNALQFPNLQFFQTMLQLMANNSSPPPPHPNIDILGLQNIPNLMAIHNLQQNNLLDMTSMMPNFSTFNGTQEVVAPMNYGLCSSDGAGASTETQTPSLVSAATPEPVKLSVSSPTSCNPLEAWDGLNLDELGGDFGWKDILDQISWSDEL